MKKKDIEQSLRNAVSDITPDIFDKIISSPIPKREEQKPARLRLVKPSTLNAVVLAAACVAVLVVGLNAIKLPKEREYTTVMIDVNPSISFTTDESGKVMSCDSLNLDAKAVVDGLSLEKQPLDDAVETLMESLTDNGYLTSEKYGAMLVSVENENEQTAADIKKQTVSDIRESIIQIKTKVKVLSQTVRKDPKLSKKASKYEISEGKTAYIEKIISKDPSLKFKKLAGMSIKEIDSLTVKKQIKIDDTVETEVVDYVNYDGKTDEIESDTGETSSYEPDDQYEPPEEVGVGSETCKQISLADAGVTASGVSRLRIYLNHESGNVYEIEFTADELRYYYTVRADSGEILSRKTKEDNFVGETETSSAKPEKDVSSVKHADKSDRPAGAQVSREDETVSSEVSSDLTRKMISSYKAQLIAIAHSGVTVDLDLQPTVQLYDDAYYIVEFVSEGMPYIYKIDAYTGGLID